MGIVSFALIVKEKYKKVKDVKMPKIIDSLFIDCNSVLYGAEKTVYLSSDSYSDEERKKKYMKGEEALEKEFLNKVVKNIQDVYDKFKPKKNFFIAIDGAGNAAKMQQQKTRRFGSTKDKEKITNPFFSTRAFTPGTNIMIKIDKAITDWLKSAKNLPEKTLYSSHLDPGEGEHKIFDYIRNDVHVKGDGANIVYGADNDLFILTLICKEENMYLYKDDFDILYDMNNAKKQTIEFMKFDGCDESKLLVDFSILMTFAGNDFLPQFPNISSSINSLDIALTAYKKNKLHLHTSENNISWKALLMLFRSINSYTINKEDLYIQSLKLKYPYKELRDSVIVKNIYGQPVNENYDSSKHYRTFDLEKFSKLWYNKQFEPQCTKLKELYNNDFYDTEDIENMCLQYLKTLEWCHIYYTEGYKKVSNYHFYNYNYLPLSVDVETYLEKMIKSSKREKLEDVKHVVDQNFNCLEQLMMVLPPQSLELIPAKYHYIYEKYLNSVNPVDFPLPLVEGTNASHHSIILIPHIDIVLTKYAFEAENVIIPSNMKNKKPLIITGEKSDSFSLKISKDYLM